jgi:predicted dehydrogenase
VRVIRFGVIGGGLMGREFASAVSRWLHLRDLDVRPEIVAVCDPDPSARRWFEDHVPTLRQAVTDHRALLDDPMVEAVYCAVPHLLHEAIYTDVLRAGKHLLGEKPFGIDRAANRRILEEVRHHPELLIRCSSEMPFFPGAYRIFELIRERRFGRIIEVEAGFWHASDLDPNKPINWKRRAETNGAYGVMGDLGMHVVHLPFRAGWIPTNVRAILSDIVPYRPDARGDPVRCDTWDNAILLCEAEDRTTGERFPMTLSMKRIAPGHTNTWFLRVWGTRLSAEFSTHDPKRLRLLPYEPGQEQAWQEIDLGYRSAYRAITGEIFEFGFPDALLQMYAAFCDELAHKEAMRQPLRCALPEETAVSHDLFTAALLSHERGEVVRLDALDVSPTLNDSLRR